MQILVWVVCDNNSDEGVLLFDCSEKAEEYAARYEYPESEDCWIKDVDGTPVY